MPSKLLIVFSLAFFWMLSPSVWASKARLKSLQLSGRGYVPEDRRLSNESDKFIKVPQVKPTLPLDQLKVPVGFEVSIFAVVPRARSMSLGENGQLFVGSRDDKVYRVTDADLNGEAEKVEVLLKDLNQPNGVAYHKGSLYVGEKSQILKVENVNSDNPLDLKAKTLAQKFPEPNQKNWKFIRFGKEDWLHVNLAVPGEARFHKLNVETGKGAFTGATPPTVGFDWDSEAQKLWVPTLQMQLPPSIIPLGVRFYRGKQFPSEFQNQVFMAEQGSWKGASPRGYRVSLVNLNNGKATAYRSFVEGWLQAGKPWGRPIDVEVFSDGSLLISDDQAGVVYRLTYLFR